MAGSGEVERAVYGSGEHELLALHSMDDPCTARLRLCRLFAYLWGHGYGELYLAARRIMPVIFHTKDLAKKVKEGQWGDATFYVNSFAPFSGLDYEARLLMQFFMDFLALDSFACNGCTAEGSYFWNWLEIMYKEPVLIKYPCFATLVENVSSKHDGALLDWQLVKNKAAKVVEEMAYKTPELRRRMLYLCGRSDLYHIVPVGCRRCVKKSFGRKQSDALAHYYLQMKKRLPSTSQGTNHNDLTAELTVLHGESLQKMLHGEPLIALYETSLEAGIRPIVKDWHPTHLADRDIPFGRTKAAPTLRVTVTTRSGPQCQPEHPFELGLSASTRGDPPEQPWTPT